MVLGSRLPGRVGRRRISQLHEGPFGGPRRVLPHRIAGEDTGEQHDAVDSAAMGVSGGPPDGR